MIHILTEQQTAREHSVQRALLMDGSMYVVYTTIAIFTGSVTMMAEVIRATMMNAIELFALVTMKRIHRGQTALFEFGTGKLEQVVNLLIAIGMLGGAVWVGFEIVDVLSGQDEVTSQAGFALGAAISTVNTVQNFFAWRGVRRAAKSGGSSIMKGQLNARVVKLVSSVVVQAALTLAALSTDDTVAALLDAGGAAFACGFTVYTSIKMFRASLPDILDRTMNEEAHAAINRVLAKHFDDYETLDRVRTRRSGELVYIEIVLGFRADLTLEEVVNRIKGMTADLHVEMANADLSVIPVSVRHSQPT